jgi:hypothetical protein
MLDKGRMYSPLSHSFRPSVPLQWRQVSGEERGARGAQTSLGHRDGCFCGGRARRDHGARSLRARGWALCRHSPRRRDRGGPRGNFGSTIGPPFRLPAPGVDRHHYLRGPGFFPDAINYTPGPCSLIRYNTPQRPGPTGVVARGARPGLCSIRAHCCRVPALFTWLVKHHRG